MDKKTIAYISIVISITLIILCLILFSNSKVGYSIILLSIAVLLLIYGINNIINSINPNRAYDSKIKNILNTFDSVLVRTSNVPNLEGRNVIQLQSISDLIDAQLEIRKPICYIKQTESCSFILLDDKETYVYVEKLNDTIESPLEIELSHLNKKNNKKNKEVFAEIDKTTIINLPNNKSYKVSPFRKESDKTEEVEVLQ